MLLPNALLLDLGVSKREHLATETVKPSTSTSIVESGGVEEGSTSIRSLVMGAQIINMYKKPSRC